MKRRVLKTLLVEPDSNHIAFLQKSLASVQFFDIRLETAERPESALALAQSTYYDLFLVADLLPPDSAANLISTLNEKEPESPIIFLCDENDEKCGYDAIRAGASDFIFKRSITERGLCHCLGAAMERVIRERNFRQAFFNIKTLANSAREGVAMMKNGLVFEANNTFSGLFGYKPAQVIGFPVTKFIRLDESMDNLSNIFSIDTYTFLECEGIRKDGSLFPAEFRGENTRFNNKTIQVFIVRHSPGRQRVGPIAGRVTSSDMVKSSLHDIDSGLSGQTAYSYSPKDLEKALTDENFLLHYQPVVDLQSGIITSIEALVRWNHPEHGLLPPTSFIPLAEESGLIVPLGEWILSQVCSNYRALENRGFGQLQASVNFSPGQLVDPKASFMVEKVLKAKGMAPGHLVIEISASSPFLHTRKHNAVLESLSEMGIQFSIDDFGTSYASLSQLNRFPNLTLKMDDFALGEIFKGDSYQTAVLSMITLSKAMNCHLVAERVERGDHLDVLRRYDCPEAQGFAISKPLTHEQLHNLMLNGKMEVKNKHFE